MHSPHFPARRFVLLLVAACCPPLSAQPVPLGPPILVNQTTAGRQSSPGVARAADGSFVVVWVDFSTSHWTVYLRRFDAAGTALGPETPVSQPGEGESTAPLIVLESGGNMLVAWSDYNSTFTTLRGFARVYDPAGVALTPPFPVTDPTPDLEWFSGATATAADTFVVAWTDDTEAGVETSWARAFDVSGAALAPAYRIAPEFEDSHGSSLTPSGADDVTASFVASPGESGYEAVQMRRFASDGSRLDPAYVVAEGDGYGARAFDIASGGRDDFVVSWAIANENPAPPTPQFGIAASDGTLLAGPYSPHFDTLSPLLLARAGDGTFVLTWCDGNGPVARAFGPTAVPFGEGIRPGPAGHTDYDLVPALDGQGDPVLVYSAWITDPSERNVYAQLYRTATVFVDGFESGDTSAWPATQP